MSCSGRWFYLVLSTLAAACSDGRKEPPAAGSTESERLPESSRDAGPARGQSQSFRRGTVPMSITAKVSATILGANGPGECASSADASIYDVPATLWHATHGGGSERFRLNLTVWRPKGGGDEMVGLSLVDEETTHQISTVKGGRLIGSGTAGVRVELSVQCDRFDEVAAEGG